MFIIPGNWRRGDPRCANKRQVALNYLANRRFDKRGRVALTKIEATLSAYRHRPKSNSKACCNSWIGAYHNFENGLSLSDMQALPVKDSFYADFSFEITRSY
ncbi:MAG: hypothetical protein NT121_20165 [Chloroflexi bacterium]|nr:hypothetical protein [Chloroflexota bacterium]